MDCDCSISCIVSSEYEFGKKFFRKFVYISFQFLTDRTIYFMAEI